MSQSPTNLSARTIYLGLPMSSATTLTNEPIPIAHIHDELHPSHSHDSPTSAGETRRAEYLMDKEKATTRQESEAVPMGVLYPSAVGNVGVMPAVPLSPPKGYEGADPEKAAMVAHAVDNDEQRNAGDFPRRSEPKERERSCPTTDNRAPLATTDSSSSSSDVPRKRFPFGKSKQAKDEKARKAQEKEDEANALPPVSFLSLFRFATPFEIFLMVIGLIFAAASGAAQPLMTLIFGRLTTSFTSYGTAVTSIAQNGSNPAVAAALAQAKHQLRVDSGNNALYLLAIGLGMFVATWLYMFIWNYVGELNSKRVREKYLRAVLRQEVSHVCDHADVRSPISTTLVPERSPLVSRQTVISFKMAHLSELRSSCSTSQPL